MATSKGSKQDPYAELFARLRPTEEELSRLRSIERAGDWEAFAEQVSKLDRKYKSRSIGMLSVDEKLINPEAARPLVEEVLPAREFAGQLHAGLLADLFGSKQLACECLVPFQFRGLDVYNSMSGPEQNGVARGMIGAIRYGANEYSVWNPGDTSGTTRVHMWGQMHITFSAEIPQAGRWCLIHPSGTLRIRGHSRVVGHGNFTTSYDAKVWVDYFQVLYVGASLVELSGGEIHYDGTRSEDRTRHFNSDRYLPPRYLFFNAAHAGDRLVLSLRMEVDTAANEDGLALGVIDQFGFLANLTTDYDTFVIKAP